MWSDTFFVAFIYSLLHLFDFIYLFLITMFVQAGLIDLSGCYFEPRVFLAHHLIL